MISLSFVFSYAFGTTFAQNHIKTQSNAMGEGMVNLELKAHVYGWGGGVSFVSQSQVNPKSVPGQSQVFAWFSNAIFAESVWKLKEKWDFRARWDLGLSRGKRTSYILICVMGFSLLIGRAPKYRASAHFIVFHSIFMQSGDLSSTKTTSSWW